MDLRDLLSELHTELAESLLTTLRSDEGASAADIRNILQLLRDNGINIDATRVKGPVKNLADELPTFDDDDEETPLRLAN